MERETDAYVLPWNKEIARPKLDQELNAEIPCKRRRFPHLIGHEGHRESAALVIKREI